MKEQLNIPGNQPIDLKMLNFSAKIDYITIYTPRKVKLPAVSGRQILAKQHEIDEEHWHKVGVGAFLKGGNREHRSVRLTRNKPVNNRIGQALMRMELQFRKTKFPPLTQLGMDDYLNLVRPCAAIEKSSMAIF